MIDKSHIEKILVLNGISPEAPEPEIKSVLIRARWHHADVENAILILRGQAIDDPVYAELHAIANSDQKVAPETLNALLGVDTVVKDISTKRIDREKQLYKKQILTLVLLATFFATVFLLFVMWEIKLGLFAVR